jgi:hypothetical protein
MHLGRTLLTLPVRRGGAEHQARSFLLLRNKQNYRWVGKPSPRRVLRLLPPSQVSGENDSQKEARVAMTVAGSVNRLQSSSVNISGSSTLAGGPNVAAIIH